MKFIYSISDAIHKNNKIYFGLYFVVIVLLTLLMMASFSPICPAYDFDFHYNRIDILIEAMKNGNFPFYLDNNSLHQYGYFTKAFYPDLVLIPFAFIGTFTSLYFAYQTLIFVITVLCGVFTFLAIKRIYKSSFVASAAGILFTFAIYRIFDIYFRGALGESITFTFIPLVSWGTYEILKGDYKKWYILSFAYFLLIGTHLISTIIVFMTMSIFLVIYYKSFIDDFRRLKYLLIAGFVTIGLSAYTVFPLLEQMLSNTFWYKSNPAIVFSYTKMLMTDLVWGLLSPFINPGIRVGGILTGFVLLRIFVKGKSPELKSVDYGIFISCVYLLACTYLFPWSVFPFTKLQIIQIPWRLFQIVSYLFAIAGAYYVYSILANNVLRKQLFLSFIVVLSLLTFKFERIYFKCEGNAVAESVVNYQNTISGGEYIPAKVASFEFLKERKNKVIAKDNTTEIQNLKNKDGLTQFDVISAEKDILELPLLYYKGYKAEINSKQLEIRESLNGLIELAVPHSGHVKVFYGGTIIQDISCLLSLVSLFSLLIYIFQIKRRSALNLKKK